MLKSLLTIFRIRWEKNPLVIILLLAFTVRFISVIFSQGYGMHDDHFLAVETPWSWTVGEDYEGWLPESQEAGKKMEAQNIAYPSINYLQFAFLKIINILLLIPVSLTYSKKSRVEAMAYFYPIRDQVNTILVDDTGRNGEMMMPVLYAGKPLHVVTLPEDNPSDTTNYSLIRYQFVVHSMHVFEQDNGIDWPEYIIFVEDIDLERETYIQPSLGDRIMKRLNPANKNEEFYIYKTNFKT